MVSNCMRRFLCPLAALAVLAVGIASTAHAQDCNGALNISIAPPPPFLAGGTFCGALTWTSSPGTTANEIVFTPSSPIMLPPNISQNADNCFLSFQVKLDNLEPVSPAADSDN